MSLFKLLSRTKLPPLIQYEIVGRQSCILHNSVSFYLCPIFVFKLVLTQMGDGWGGGTDHHPSSVSSDIILAGYVECHMQVLGWK